MSSNPNVKVSEVDVDALPDLIWHRGMGGYYRKHLRKLTEKRAIVFEFGSEDEYKKQRYSVMEAAKSMYGKGRVTTRRLPGTNKLYVWLRQPPDPEFVPEKA